MSTRESILPSLKGDVWAIHQPYFRAMQRAMERFALVSADEIKAAQDRAEARQPRSRREKSIALIPILGPLEKRQTVLGELCGWMSMDQIGQVFDAAIADPQVSSVLFDIDSPGGTVTGTPELASKIFSARGTKPIVAVANGMAASAAYWIGSAADRLYVTPSGDVGSVGVLSIHENHAGALEQEGVEVEFIVADGSPYKVEGHPYGPLEDEARAEILRNVNAWFDEFTATVARHRGTTPGVVRSDFGKGRMVRAKEAVSRGMADRVATLEDVASRLLAGRIKTSGPAAADDWDAPAGEPVDVRRKRLELRGRGA